LCGIEEPVALSHAQIAQHFGLLIRRRQVQVVRLAAHVPEDQALVMPLGELSDLNSSAVRA
jgi:hypothetical protein